LYKLKALDKRWIGFVVGLVLPFLVITGLYLGSDTIEVDFVTYLINGWEYRLFATLLPMALLMNLAAFLIFIQRRRMLFCQGMVFSTAIYGVVILLLRI
jgi:hypothetical protein